MLRWLKRLFVRKPATPPPGHIIYLSTDIPINFGGGDK